MNKIRIDTIQVQDFEKEHIETVRKLAPECMVLLKNNGLLPLKETGKLALYGSGARKTVKGGTGSDICNTSGFEDLKPEGAAITYEGEAEEKANAKVISIRGAELAVRKTVYQEAPAELQAGPAVRWCEVLIYSRTDG